LEHAIKRENAKCFRIALPRPVRQEIKPARRLIEKPCGAYKFAISGGSGAADVAGNSPAESSANGAGEAMFCRLQTAGAAGGVEDHGESGFPARFARSWIASPFRFPWKNPPSTSAFMRAVAEDTLRNGQARCAGGRDLAGRLSSFMQLF